MGERNPRRSSPECQASQNFAPPHFAATIMDMSADMIIISIPIETASGSKIDQMAKMIYREDRTVPLSN